MTIHPRVVLAGLFHETHTFLDGTTPLSAFARREGDALLAARGDGSPMDGFLEVADRHGWSTIPAIDMRAAPSATVDDDVIEAFWDGLARNLELARRDGAIDAVFFVLHGAMVSASYPDVEGEILARTSARLAPERPLIFGVLDLHANAGAATVEHVDGLVAYRCNPHTDARAATMDAAEALARCLATGERPTVCLRRANVLWPPTGTGTDDGPMRRLEAVARELEVRHDELWSVSVLAGFAYADAADTGVSFLAVCTDAAVAGEALRTLVHETWRLRHGGLVTEEDPDAVLERILPVRERPVVLTEPSDNIGGGAPGDGTGALRALLAHDVPSALVTINDASAIAALSQCPLGSDVTLAIGGRGSRFDAGPVTLPVTLVSRSDGRFELEDRHSHLASMVGVRVDMGPCAVVRHGGITLLLTSRKTPPFDLGQLRSQGLEPTDFDLVVVKAAVAHRRAYGPIAQATYALATPGPCPSDLTSLPYHRLARPVFPFDDHFDPLTVPLRRPR